METLRALTGQRTKAEKRAAAAQAEALTASNRATNAAAEERQRQAAETAYAVRRAGRGRRQLSWMPLGGMRPVLGATTGLAA